MLDPIFQGYHLYYGSNTIPHKTTLENRIALFLLYGALNCSDDMKSLSAFLVLATLLCCSSQPCQPRLKHLFFVPAYNGDEIAFGHHVFIDGLNESCIDSASIIPLVNQYFDTLTIGKPVLAISIYRSLDNYIPGEKAQRWEQFRKDCIVRIKLDERSSKFMIEEFTFYGTNGSPLAVQRTWP